jgi:hypothetical protein
VISFEDTWQKLKRYFIVSTPYPDFQYLVNSVIFPSTWHFMKMIMEIPCTGSLYFASNDKLSGVHKISITLQRYQLESTSKDIV